MSAKANAKWSQKEVHSKLNKGFDIVIPYETFAQWANANRETKTISGFRPGKAPLSSFKEDWAVACARAIADEIIANDNLQNIYNLSYVLNHFALGEEIKMTLNIDIYPEIPNIDFSSINLTKHTTTISKKDIKEAITRFMNQNFKPAALQDKRPVEMNDYLNVSVELTDPKGHKERMNSMDIQVGKRTFLPEIEEKLIGKNVSDKIEHEFTIPESHAIVKDPSLIGKEIKIALTINAIQGSVNLDTSDLLNKFQVTDETGLEKKFEDNLEQEASKWTNFLLKESLKHELAKIYFEIPMDLLHRKFIEFRAQIFKDINYQEGQDLAALVKETLHIDSLEEFDRRIVFGAENVARLEFLIGHLGRVMQINVSSIELDDEIAHQKQMFPEGLNAAVKFFEENPEAKNNLRNAILERKTLMAIIAKCKINPKEHAIEEFYKLKATPEAIAKDSSADDANSDSSSNSTKKISKTGDSAEQEESSDNAKSSTKSKSVSEKKSTKKDDSKKTKSE